MEVGTLWALQIDNYNLRDTRNPCHGPLASFKTSAAAADLFWALLLDALFQEQCGVIWKSPEARTRRLEVWKHDLREKCDQPCLHLMLFCDLVKG